MKVQIKNIWAYLSFGNRELVDNEFGSWQRLPAFGSWQWIKSIALPFFGLPPLHIHSLVDPTFSTMSFLSICCCCLYYYWHGVLCDCHNRIRRYRNHIQNSQISIVNAIDATNKPTNANVKSEKPQLDGWRVEGRCCLWSCCCWLFVDWLTGCCWQNGSDFLVASIVFQTSLGQALLLPIYSLLKRYY